MGKQIMKKETIIKFVGIFSILAVFVGTLWAISPREYYAFHGCKNFIIRINNTMNNGDIFFANGSKESPLCDEKEKTTLEVYDTKYVAKRHNERLGGTYETFVFSSNGYMCYVKTRG